MTDSKLTQQRISRLSPVALVIAGALALPPAFSQGMATPQAAPATAPAAPAQAAVPAPAQDATPAQTSQTPMQEAPPAPATSATTATQPADFNRLDVNKDGKLSRDEVASDPTWSADFDVADTNKDGFLSKSEFKKHAMALLKASKAAGTQG